MYHFTYNSELLREIRAGSTQNDCSCVRPWRAFRDHFEQRQRSRESVWLHDYSRLQSYQDSTRTYAQTHAGMFLS